MNIITIILIFFTFLRCGQLQQENGELKGQMKLLRKRLKDAEKADARNASLKVDLDQTQTTLNAEIRSLQKQVDNRIYLQIQVHEVTCIHVHVYVLTVSQNKQHIVRGLVFSIIQIMLCIMGLSLYGK